jgi:hypothetical protein
MFFRAPHMYKQIFVIPEIAFQTPSYFTKNINILKQNYGVSNLEFGKLPLVLKISVYTCEEP